MLYDKELLAQLCLKSVALKGVRDKRNLFSLPSVMNQGERNGFSKLRMR